MAVLAVALVICISAVPIDESDAELSVSDVTYIGNSEGGAFYLQVNSDLAGETIVVTINSSAEQYRGTAEDDGSVVCTPVGKITPLTATSAQGLDIEVSAFRQNVVKENVVIRSISFDMNGGSGTDIADTIYATAGAEVTIPDVNWTMNGQDFIGWSEDDASVEAEQMPGTYTVPDRNVEFFAIYGTVEEPTVTGIEIAQPPSKTEYKVGEELKLDGLQIRVTYSYGETETIPYDAETMNVSKVDMSTAGEKTVTVTYEGKSTEFKITVSEGDVPATLTGIDVTTLPEKTAYTVGEKLDLSGLEVTATYSDNSSREVTRYTTDPANGAALNSTGSVTVTVSYTEDGVTKTDTFIVTVEEESPAVLTGIMVTTPPEKTEYFEGDELDTSGMVVTATYEGGASRNVTGYSISEVDMSTPGPKTVTVSYTENGVTKTDTFDITVEAIVPVGIEVAPEKEIYTVGDVFDATVQVYLVKNNGDRELLTEGYKVTFTQNGVEIVDGQTLEVADDIIITATYGSYPSATYTVIVKEPGQVVIDVTVLGGGAFGTLYLQFNGGVPEGYTSSDRILVDEGTLVTITYDTDLVITPTLTLNGKAIQVGENGYSFTADSDSRVMISFIADDDDDETVNPPVYVPEDDGDSTTYIVVIAAAAVVAILAALILMQTRKS